MVVRVCLSRLRHSPRADDPELAGDDRAPHVATDVGRRRVSAARRRGERAAHIVGGQAGGRIGHGDHRGPGVLGPTLDRAAVDPAPVLVTCGRGGCGGDRRGRGRRGIRLPGSGHGQANSCDCGASHEELSTVGDDRFGQASRSVGHVQFPSGAVVYLIPVVAMPSMNRRWRMRKTITMGRTTTVAPAIKRPKLVSFWPVENSANATGSV